DPVVAQPRIARARAAGTDVRPDARLLIHPAHHVQLARVVDPAAVGRIDDVVHAVAGPDRHPVFHGDDAAPPVARALPRVVILQAAVDVVRVVHVHADRVDLAD